jgi:hypothetical protein
MARQGDKRSMVAQQAIAAHGVTRPSSNVQ